MCPFAPLARGLTAQVGEHLALACGELGERVFAAASPEQAGNDGRVDDGLALGDAT
jgi:hypothetical protein